jgi:hypothetical protein
MNQSKEIFQRRLAHRFSSLQYCDYIVEKKNGKVHWVGTYSEIESGPALH